MTDVAPAKLADTKVRVLNASGQGGQAAEVAGGLRDLGFGQPTAANDPVYANTRLVCQGQLRFGRAGQAAAAAVWLVAPCVELIRTNADDDTVDFALGTEFKTLTHSDDIDAMLASLRPEATHRAGPFPAAEDPHQRRVLVVSAARRGRRATRGGRAGPRRCPVRRPA